MNEPYDLTINDWIFRIQPPDNLPPRAILVAIHGLTGNQYSMEIFTQKLRHTFWVIYPRAPYPASGGGFSWVENAHGYHQDFLDLEEVSAELNLRIELIQEELNIPPLPIYVMGFSQGAALALVYSVRFASPQARTGLLAGFLPEGLAPIPGKLARHRYFVAHGRKDDTIPVARAQEMVAFLEASGAWVDYCEADTGHKLSMECFKRLENFFAMDDPK